MSAPEPDFNITKQNVEDANVDVKQSAANKIIQTLNELSAITTSLTPSFTALPPEPDFNITKQNVEADTVHTDIVRTFSSILNLIEDVAVVDENISALEKIQKFIQETVSVHNNGDNITVKNIAETVVIQDIIQSIIDKQLTNTSSIVDTSQFNITKYANEVVNNVEEETNILTSINTEDITISDNVINKAVLHLSKTVNIIEDSYTTFSQLVTQILNENIAAIDEYNYNIIKLIDKTVNSINNETSILISVNRKNLAIFNEYRNGITKSANEAVNIIDKRDSNISKIIAKTVVLIDDTISSQSITQMLDENIAVINEYRIITTKQIINTVSTSDAKNVFYSSYLAETILLVETEKSAPKKILSNQMNILDDKVNSISKALLYTISLPERAEALKLGIAIVNEERANVYDNTTHTAIKHLETANSIISNKSITVLKYIDDILTINRKSINTPSKIVGNIVSQNNKLILKFTKVLDADSTIKEAVSRSLADLLTIINNETVQMNSKEVNVLIKSTSENTAVQVTANSMKTVILVLQENITVEDLITIIEQIFGVVDKERVTNIAQFKEFGNYINKTTILEKEETRVDEKED